MRLAEVYTSVQGEGPNVGVPIQFVRFGGCNMRCPGWPCDTQFAIDPQYSDDWKRIDPVGVQAMVMAWPRHVCITGGEPLIQRRSDMQALGEGLLADDYKIDLFTNGSQAFFDWCGDPRVCIVMDWKLPGSGEEFTGIVQRRENLRMLRRRDAVKFVVKDKDDLEAAKVAYEEHAPFAAQVFVGAAWGHIDDQDVIEFMAHNKLDWKLNVQVHKYIWSPEQRGV